MYFRFVDDIFSHLRTKARVWFFSNSAKVFRRRFITQEGERECSLPFLDVKVGSRADDGIITSMPVCIVNRRSPVAIPHGTRWARPAIKSTSSFHCRTGYFGFVHRLYTQELKILWTNLSKNCYPGYILAKLVTRDPPGCCVGARFCPIVLQVRWLWKRTEELVRKANKATRLAYFAGDVRPVYRTTLAFSLPKDRLPTFSQSTNIFIISVAQLGRRPRGFTDDS